jgi:PAS domain S-box-containing protein
VGGAPGILVVDDQAENLTALEQVLEPLGRDLVRATSGEEALRRLLDGDFAVIVMDVRMPGLDGFQTVELIKQRPRHADTAVVFLTAADPDAEQILRGYETGAVDYILKPVDADVLRSKVAMLLELQEKNAALRTSEERFRTAFEGAPIGMALTTTEGEWLEVNDALCDLLGRSPAQLMAVPLWELAHPADRDEERERLEAMLSRQPRFDQREIRFARGDGSAVHGLVNVSLLLDAQGRPFSYIWQLVDVTEQRRGAAERAARAEAEAVAAAVGKLQAVTEAALQHLSLPQLLDQLAAQVRGAFSADLARILLREDDDEPLTLGATSGFEADDSADPVPLEGLLERVLEERRTVSVADLPDGAGLDPALAAERPRALMAAPLNLDGRPAGIVTVGVRSPRRFDAGEEGLLLLMAERAGLAIQRARAFARERSNVEMLQRNLLPDRLPYVEGLQIATRYRPGGAEVGGDWYDAIPLGDGRLGVAMGDVVGHGLAAASLMGQLRYATRAYALEGHSPGVVLDRLDRLVRSLDGGEMATLLYMHVDPAEQRIRFASAGHVPPLFVAADGTATYLASAPNPPLGVFDSEAHVELTADLEPGVALVLYTDGLVERRGVSIDVGLDALRVAASHPDPPEELCDRLMATRPDVEAADDDIAILVLRAQPLTVEPLHLELPADPTLLGSVRRDLARWLSAGGATAEDVEAVQMACHEACSNAIEHAYAFGEGTITIDGNFDEGHALMTVRDNGSWIERAERLPYRGHGLPMMEALMESVEVVHDEDGTAVQMERRLAGDRLATA